MTVVANFGLMGMAQARSNGWDSLSRACRLLTPAVRQPDCRGVWKFVQVSEVAGIRAANARNQNALIWVRRALRQPLTGRAHGFNTEDYLSATQLSNLGYALINDGRVKEWSGQAGAACSAFADAIELANAVNKPGTARSHRELFYAMTRMAGVARLELFFSAKYLNCREWDQLYQRWKRLSQQLPALPQTADSVEAARLQLARRCLALENEAVDILLWACKFYLKH
jgi:hypothetical protein